MSCPCLPLSDTVKRVDGGVVVETIPRDDLVGGSDAAGVRRRPAAVGLRRRPCGSDRLRVARRARRREDRGRRRAILGSSRSRLRTTSPSSSGCSRNRRRAGPCRLLRRRRDARRRGAVLAGGGRVPPGSDPMSSGRRSASRSSAARSTGGSGAIWASSGPRTCGTVSGTRPTTCSRMLLIVSSACERAACSSGLPAIRAQGWRRGRGAALPADVVTGSAGLGAASPNRRSSNGSSSWPAAPPAEVAYVGDRADNDARPALAAGLVAVHLRRGPWGRLQPTPEGAIAISSLAELPAALPASAS